MDMLQQFKLNEYKKYLHVLGDVVKKPMVTCTIFNNEDTSMAVQHINVSTFCLQIRC